MKILPLITRTQKEPYEGRETYEWRWGGKTSPFQHHDKEYNPDDEIVEHERRK